MQFDFQTTIETAMIRVSIIIALLFLAGCATALTPEDRSYLSTAMNFQHKTIDRDHIGDCWGRAQLFCAKHSPLKLEIATDFVLETYVSRFDESMASYKILKTPVDGGFTIDVLCHKYDVFDPDIEIKNARVAYYYIVSGEEPPKGLVR